MGYLGDTQALDLSLRNLSRNVNYALLRALLVLLCFCEKPPAAGFCSLLRLRHDDRHESRMPGKKGGRTVLYKPKFKPDPTQLHSACGRCSPPSAMQLTLVGNRISLELYILPCVGHLLEVCFAWVMGAVFLCFDETSTLALTSRLCLRLEGNVAGLLVPCGGDLH